LIIWLSVMAVYITEALLEEVTSRLAPACQTAMMPLLLLWGSEESMDRSD
ncbi:hypothetical protein BAE44_0002707, partial [Dichanthelium oligosanthes]